MNYKSLATVAASAFLLFSMSGFAWGADQGAHLYKKKCSSCHGHHGEGKPAVKAPALKGTTSSADQIVQQITKGDPQSKAPHNKAISGIGDEEAKSIAEFIKTLK